MPRKARDYSGERNARDVAAQAAGWKSYRQQRYYVEGLGSRRRDEKMNVPKGRIPGMTSAQVARAHYDAYEGPFSVKTMGWRDKPSAAVRRWHVEIIKDMTAAEWDPKYPNVYED